eukprot:g60746.t1
MSLPVANRNGMSGPWEESLANELRLVALHLCVCQASLTMSEFETAAADARKLKDVSQAQMLQLYALYKQATVGDVQGSQPWAVQLEARAKWDSWNGVKGKSKEAAEQEYIALVKKLQSEQK